MFSPHLQEKEDMHGKVGWVWDVV